MKKSSSRSKRAFVLPNVSTRWSALPTPMAPSPNCAANIRRNKDGRWKSSGEFVTLPARAVMIAAGTHPNTTYDREHPGTFQLDDKGEFYRGHKLHTNGEVKQLVPAGPGEIGFFTSYEKQGRYVTFFGDNHPHYAGNVVKAMASAKDGHPRNRPRFPGRNRPSEKPEDQSERERNWVMFAESLDEQLVAEVVDALRLTHQIVEVVVRAPLAARNFHPGEFYRLQNYETFAEEVDGIKLTMEGIALTGAWVDRERGLISLIVLEMGGSSRLCSLLEPGEKIVLMGPTGTPTEIPHDQTVVLAGGGLGNAVLFSIALALKENHNRVIYFAGYRAPTDLFKRQEIEKACDVVVWSTDRGPGIQPARPQDRTFLGNIVEAMASLRFGQTGRTAYPIGRRPPHHRHRLRPHDGGREARARRQAATVLPEPTDCHRLDQLADAMHDERNLRRMFPAPRGPANERGIVRL